MARPSVSELNELLSYDKDSGELRWKSSGKGRRAGGLAGSEDKTAVRVTVKGKRYSAHRIAWAMHCGEWPSDTLMLDHKNLDPYDNRISNLRLATNQQNQFNRPAKNYTKLPDGKYRVGLTLDGKLVSFGRYVDEELAMLVASEARDKYHGEFAYRTA